jgi:hypothetical protein
MIELHDRFGKIDLTLITEAAVASLSEAQQEALGVLVDAVKAREAADLRKIAAEKRVRAAMIAETETLAAHIAANPPPSRIEALRASQAAYNQANK